MYGVVGRPAGRQQADNGINNRLFIDDVTDGRIAISGWQKTKHLSNRFLGQGIAHGRTRVYK